MIKSIKYKNHPSLGNIELDFCKDDGTPYNTIIFAGENGTGKTTLLETLSNFFNFGHFTYFENIKYIINNNNYTILQSKKHKEDSCFLTRINDITNEKEELTIINDEDIERDNNNIRKYGCVYSKARSGFYTEAITSITTEHTNIKKYDDDSNYNFTAGYERKIKYDYRDFDIKSNNILLKGIISEIKYKYEIGE